MNNLAYEVNHNAAKIQAHVSEAVNLIELKLSTMNSTFNSLTNLVRAQANTKAHLVNLVQHLSAQITTIGNNRGTPLHPVNITNTNNTV